MFCKMPLVKLKCIVNLKNLRLGSRPFTFIGQFNETSSPDLVRGQHKKSSQTGGQYEEDA